MKGRGRGPLYLRKTRSGGAFGLGGPLLDVGDEWKVPEPALVVEPVTDHMAVGYGEPDVVGLNVHLPPFRLVEEGADLDRFRTAQLQLLLEVGQGDSRVQNVLHDQKVGLLDPERGREDDLDEEVGLPRGGDFQESYPDRELDLADQIGEEHEGSLQDSQDRQLLPLVVDGNLLSDLADPFRDLGVGSQNL